MKKFFKKVPAIIVVSLIIVITVAFAVFAANSEAVVAWLDYYVKGDVSALTDVDHNGTINILDAIALHNNLDVATPEGFTRGIY